MQQGGNNTLEGGGPSHDNGRPSLDGDRPALIGGKQKFAVHPRNYKTFFIISGTVTPACIALHGGDLRSHA